MLHTRQHIPSAVSVSDYSYKKRLIQFEVYAVWSKSGSVPQRTAHISCRRFFFLATYAYTRTRNVTSRNYSYITVWLQSASIWFIATELQQKSVSKWLKFEIFFFFFSKRSSGLWSQMSCETLVSSPVQYG